MVPDPDAFIVAFAPPLYSTFPDPVRVMVIVSAAETAASPEPLMRIVADALARSRAMNAPEPLMVTASRSARPFSRMSPDPAISACRPPA